jgi:hypothetical protein
VIAKKKRREEEGKTELSLKGSSGGNVTGNSDSGNAISLHPDGEARMMKKY